MKQALVVVVGFALLLPASAAANCGDGPSSGQGESIHCASYQEPIDDLALPRALVGTGYAYRFEPSPAGVTTFAVKKDRELPGGLRLDPDGLLSGIPTVPGRFSFVVIAYNPVTGDTEQRVTMDVGAPPALTLDPADAVTQTTALLRGWVVPGEFGDDVWFEYWPTGAQDALSTAAEAIGSGVDPVLLSRKVVGLSPATEYSFRLAATNEASPEPFYSETGTLRTAAPPRPPAQAVLAESVSTELPPPQAGKSFNIEPAGGNVSTRCSSDGAFRKLDKPKQVTLDCEIDAENGTVSITASKGSSGETQTALFWGSVFDIGQEAGDNREAVMTLAGQRRCEKRRGGRGNGRQQRSRKGSHGRRLWGSGQGNYKTVGSHGSATVRGTIWLVADRCDGSTLFKVRRGTVVVRDFIKRSSVVLEAGQSYIAKVAIGRLP
jgi:Putative Ig domain